MPLISFCKFVFKNMCVVRPLVATMTTVSSSWRGVGGISKVGVEVTCQADPHIQESRAVWARDDGSCRRLGAIFPCLPALLCCICPAGFRSLGALVDCGSPPTYLLSCSFPRVGIDCECLERGLQAVLGESVIWQTHNVSRSAEL